MSEQNTQDNSNQMAIEIEDLGVIYNLPHERLTSIKEFAIRWLQGRIRYRELHALQEVTLKIPTGTIFGVVGPNGAGKTTLLKTIARVLHPTHGRVQVRGDIAPLLDLFAGFHPELTGRENVYLYGTLLGHSRRVLDKSLNAIVDFAELWDFLDVPMRSYSSGMMARLGFSIATFHPAQVLLVDEVLAVGDLSFRAKCLERMRAFRQQGATIVYVTHDLGEAKAICDQAAWLDGGRLQAVGPADEVITAYETA